VGNLKQRLEKLERVRWAGSPPIAFIVRFVGPDGPEPLTAEETAALEAYKEKMVAGTKARGIVVIHWTPEKARELFALDDKKPDGTQA
jgi:hypothetical protein